MSPIPTPHVSTIPMAAAIPISGTTTSASGAAQALSSLSIVECNDSAILTKEQISQLQDQGVPQGLAAELGRTRATYPLRFWVVDNSGEKIACVRAKEFGYPCIKD